MAHRRDKTHRKNRLYKRNSVPGNARAVLRLFICVMSTFFVASTSVLASASAAPNTVDVPALRAQYRGQGPTAAVVADIKKDFATLSGQQEESKMSREFAELIILLAEVTADQGQSTEAYALMAPYKEAIKALNAPAIQSAFFYRAGQLASQTGQSDEAIADFRSALRVMDQQGDFGLRAQIQNDVGLLLVDQAALNEAVTVLKLAFDDATRGGNIAQQVQVSVNLTRAVLDSGDYKSVPKLLSQSRALLERSAAPTLDHWLSMGKLYYTASQKVSGDEQYRVAAYNAFSHTVKVAQTNDDKVMESYALGYLGRLYESEQRYNEAMRYTLQAQFSAQEVAALESAYLWEWQAARLYREMGQIESALDSYAQALRSLTSVRSRLATGKIVDFKTDINPLYYQYADLLIQKMGGEHSAAAKQAILKQVINTLEQAKLAEVEDYFDSDCVLLSQEQVDLTGLARRVAVLYPVILNDRVELLLQIDGRIEHYTGWVSAETLAKQVRQFREEISFPPGTGKHRVYGKQIYDWLIAPVAKALEKSEVDTLVFVPDGALRTIPISALYDGESYLIQKIAIATTPGVTLTAPKAFRAEDTRVLANGLSAAVQGYSALPNVEAEIQEISELFPTERYENEQYQLSTIADEMSAGDYSIVHFATHGEFNRDHTKSYLLTYDGKLTMNMLGDYIGQRRFSEDPLELLVLSACQTAVGDERAALGLAGVALKAGARSALASLWFVDDLATKELITQFYEQLKQGADSKAVALQKAQNTLITAGMDHPRLWAPFLLIGNWL